MDDHPKDSGPVTIYLLHPVLVVFGIENLQLVSMAVVFFIVNFIKELQLRFLNDLRNINLSRARLSEGNHP